MKLLAFGDLHLGAGTALGREPGSRLADQAAVLEDVVALAGDGMHDVDAILVAGDVFEGPLVMPEQLDIFAAFVTACAERDIPIVAISGNGKHDAAMRTVNGLAIFDRLPGIAVYSRPALHRIGDVTIACLPWVSPARLIASEGADTDRDHINDTAAKLLVTIAAGLREAASGPTVLMLHGSLSGASLPAGIATDELREPVVDIYALEELGFDAIVASHIHVPQARIDGFWTQSIQPHAPGNPPVVYTGSPMPLNFGETGVPHGVWILDVDEGGTRAEFVPVESRPLRQATFDLAALDVDGIDPLVEFDGILDANAWPDVGEAIVKVTLRCTQAQQRRFDIARLRGAVLGAGAHTVKIDVDTVREQRSRVDGVTGDLDPLDAFDMWASSNDIEPDLAAALREQMQADLEAVGA